MLLIYQTYHGNKIEFQKTVQIEVLEIGTKLYKVFFRHIFDNVQLI